MPAWTRVQGINHGEAFTRPLGVHESAFYWDTVLSGVSDTLQQLTLEADETTSVSPGLFSLENITRAWLVVKKKHPLLGASVHERPGTTGVDFVVDETRLSAVGPDEIVFQTSREDRDACQLIDNILNGPRRLSNERLVQLWFISFPQVSHHSPAQVRYQFFIHIAHPIQDGMAQNTIVKEFFDILVHPTTPDMYVPKGGLETRLALHPAIDDLHPTRKYPVPRQRWRRAIAQVILSKRITASKGGHTLPRTIIPHTPRTPTISRTLRLQLSKELSKRIFAYCRQTKITLGHALPVLAQLAHARVLHRLYSQGSIPAAEWAHRVVQPMHFVGPLNIRPYLDQEWLETGGAGRVCLAISYYRNTLPAMPVGWLQGSQIMREPPFEALLSQTRFLNRCRMAKRQTSDYLAHPLLTEFSELLRPSRLAKAWLDAQKWRAELEARSGARQEGNFHSGVGHAGLMPVYDLVAANSCSTFGNMDNMVPAEFPLYGRNGASPRIRITSIRHYLHCRPTQLYLTSISYHQELQLVVFCDVRTYDEALVREWLSYIGEAIEWYLGRPHSAKVGEIHMARL